MVRLASHRCARPRRTSAFTLVELLIVVIILGILSAIVLPRIGSQRSEAVASALKANVCQVVMLLEHQKQKTTGGLYPSVIETDWFVSGQLPHHPDQMAGVPPIEIVSAAGQQHPRSKLMQPGASGAYWYNSATGAFRARVKSQGSTADTQAYYDDVNGTTPARPPASTPVAASMLGSDSDAEPGF